MVYLVQRPDCERLSLAGDIDPAYVRAFEAARAAGVEAYAVGCRITEDEIVADRPVTLAI